MAQGGRIGLDCPQQLQALLFKIEVDTAGADQKAAVVGAQFHGLHAHARQLSLMPWR